MIKNKKYPKLPKRIIEKLKFKWELKEKKREK